MFSPDNRIIIVDDVVSELETLSHQFYKNGIACRACQYDSFFDSPFDGVRVAFFDIDINPSGGSTDAQIFNSVATAIKQYIAPSNGPFALIFWTKNKTKVDSLRNFIHTHHQDCPKPFLVNYIDKDEFSDNRKSLENKLKEILGDNTIDILFSVEKLVHQAASQTLKQINSIIPSNDKWGDSSQYKDNFDKIFSKIAVSALGFKNAKENPDKAVYEALIPMLGYHILSHIGSNKWIHILSALSRANKHSELKSPQGFKESILNTMFHVEFHKQKKDARGAVLNMRVGKERIKQTFGYTFEELTNSIFAFKKDFKSNETAAKLALISSTVNNSKFVAIEISSACDYQQNNSRLNKYLLGILIDKVDSSILTKKDSNLIIGPFNIDSREQCIYINLNLVFAALPGDSRFGKFLFMFKKEMMDMIGNRYANHVSRIGITTFG